MIGSTNALQSDAFDVVAWDHVPIGMQFVFKDDIEAIERGDLVHFTMRPFNVNVKLHNLAAVPAYRFAEEFANNVPNALETHPQTWGHPPETVLVAKHWAWPKPGAAWTGQ